MLWIISELYAQFMREWFTVCIMVLLIYALYKRTHLALYNYLHNSGLRIISALNVAIYARTFLGFPDILCIAVII